MSLFGNHGKKSNMLTFAEKYKFNVYSQNGEDGIIAELITRINPQVKTAVEFGCPSFAYCSNTALLANNGWEVTMYDRDFNDDTRILEKMITVDNVNEIGEPTLLSIDIDNNDYHVWKAYKGKPDIVIIEINSSIEPGIEMIPGDMGASYSSMVRLGLDKGYNLIAHTGNLIWLLNKHIGKFPEFAGYHPLKDSHLFFNKSFL